MRYFLYATFLMILLAWHFFIPPLPLWQWFRGTTSEIRVLKLESVSLKAQLLALQQEKTLHERSTSQLLAAAIYSTYPFNDRHLFTIAAGSTLGVREGLAVLVEKNVLLGRITKTFTDYSEATSVFSPDWRLPVKIGDGGINGLLAGGPDPKITLIASDKKVAVGDLVYAASKEVPYGYVIGTIRSIQQTSGSFFNEAELTMPYTFNDLNYILIRLSH